MGVIIVKNAVLPVTHYVTSPFGKRTDPVTGVENITHNGIDLVGWNGKNTCTSDILAYDDGMVVTAATGSETGNYVVVRTDNMDTYYLHLQTISVVKGQTVKRGDKIGYMGSTGKSTGAHLHFGIKIDGSWVDPLPYLQGTETKNESDTVSDWAKDAVEWAKTNGIMYGDENGNIMPKDALTREAFCTMLYRYDKIK